MKLYKTSEVAARFFARDYTWILQRYKAGDFRYENGMTIKPDKVGPRGGIYGAQFSLDNIQEMMLSLYRFGVIDMKRLEQIYTQIVLERDFSK